MATKATEKPEGADQETEGPDSPLLDLSDAGVRAMIKRAKKRGYVTIDEINAVMPAASFT
ncbi:MAG: RNA polymerase sigma factor region1.1 domain-containing protein, partial [Phreatobacter sp.]|nr:RNA polymerase sigma factor region1.1 domain-containing protein [Phreatobacter sp.]